MGYFENIHQLAGPELAESCAKFIGACPTSSRVTSAFGASNNFQCIPLFFLFFIEEIFTLYPSTTPFL